MALKYTLYFWEMKHRKVNTFIHFFRKRVHIDCRSAQFKHWDGSLSQRIERPRCMIWWNSDAGYVVLTCIRYVSDFQNPQWGSEGMFSSLHKPQSQTSERLQLLACITVPPNGKKTPERGSWCERCQVENVTKLFLETKQEEWEENDWQASFEINLGEVCDIIIS